MRTLAIAFIVFSSSVYACPNLAGKYAVCLSSTGQSTGSTNMHVQQSMVNQIMTYQVTAINSQTNESESETYTANGSVQSVVTVDPETGIEIELTTSSSCSGNVLNINRSMNVEGVPTVQIAVKVSKLGKQLIIESKLTEGEVIGEDREICE